MSTQPIDLAASLAPKSDQMNADDLMAGPRTFTIAEVRAGSDEQPFNFYLAEFPTGRPYKPGLSMRRVIVAAWGSNAAAYVGRRFTLYNDPDITFGRDKVGGIRISHMSHLPDGKPLKVNLTVTRAKRSLFTLQPLPDHAPSSPALSETEVKIAALTREWHAATAERKADIEAEVAVLRNEPIQRTPEATREAAE